MTTYCRRCETKRDGTIYKGREEEINYAIQNSPVYCQPYIHESPLNFYYQDNDYTNYSSKRTPAFETLNKKIGAESKYNHLFRRNEFKVVSDSSKQSESYPVKSYSEEKIVCPKCNKRGKPHRREIITSPPCGCTLLCFPCTLYNLFTRRRRHRKRTAYYCKKCNYFLTYKEFE